MKLKQCLLINSLRLKKVDIPTPTLDVEILLCEVLNKNRAWVLAHPEYEISNQQLDVLNSYVERRTKHEPIAYIRGKQEFYGRDFHVSPDTLTPRPETETMLELLLDLVTSKLLTVDRELQIVDVGTGSGCIVITAALELNKLLDIKYRLSFLGLDISKPALKIAEQNAKNLGADIEYKHFDLLKDHLSSSLKPHSSSLILANLPYVPTDFQINLAATHEPDFAIYGGDDGLTYYRELFAKLTSAKYVVTESLPPQHTKLEEIAKNAGYKELKKKDFIQVFTNK